MKKLIKKLILVSGLTGLSFSDYLKRIDVLADTATENTTTVPKLTHTPLVIKAKVDGITTY